MKLLDAYHQQKLTTVDIIQLFVNRKKLRQNKLWCMIDYARSQTQLRNQISQYFGNDTQQLAQDMESVGVTAWQPEELNLVREEKTEHMSEVLDWSQQLKKLFNLR